MIAFYKFPVKNFPLCSSSVDLRPLSSLTAWVKNTINQWRQLCPIFSRFSFLPAFFIFPVILPGKCRVLQTAFQQTTILPYVYILPHALHLGDLQFSSGRGHVPRGEGGRQFGILSCNLKKRPAPLSFLQKTNPKPSKAGSGLKGGARERSGLFRSPKSQARNHACAGFRA